MPVTCKVVNVQYFVPNFYPGIKKFRPKKGYVIVNIQYRVAQEVHYLYIT